MRLADARNFRGRAQRRERQRGYLLPAVLMITAAIMIFITLAYDRTQDELRDVGRLLAAHAGAIERASAQATVLYALLTENASALGFGLTPGSALRVDGRPYSYGEQTLVRIRDTAGLLDINRADITALRRLAEYVGVPADRRDILADRILDFIDADDLRRLNGAEAADYAAAGAPPPRNRPLDAPRQVRGVLGWDTLLSPSQAALFESALAVDTIGAINPNAAPAAVLTAALGIPPQLADALVARREQGALLSEVDLAAAMPALTTPLSLIVDPIASRRVLVTFVDRVTGLGTTMQLSLTPFGQHWPWTVDFIEPHAESDVGAAGKTAQPFPVQVTRKPTNESEPDRMF